MTGDQHVVADSQLLASIDAPPSASQPLSVEQMRAREFGLESRAPEAVDRLSVQVFGFLTVGHQGLRPGVHTDPPIGVAAIGLCTESVETALRDRCVVSPRRSLDHLAQRPHRDVGLRRVLVLTDDNFVSIAAAVEEGRITFDNIRKVTFFLVSCGATEVLAILVGVWLQWPLLLLPAQLLWLNVITNGLQDVALAFEPGERGVLQRPPRSSWEGVLSKTLWERTALAAIVMAAGTLVMFRWELDRTDSVPMAQTVALTTLVVFQVFQAGNSRSESDSLFRISPISNPFLFAATLAAVGLHVLALYLPPTQYILRVEPIGIDTWIRIILTASAILIAMEADKLVRRRRRTRAQAP